jgi:hypothetical protein
MAHGSCPLLVLNPQSAIRNPKSEIHIDFIGAFSAFGYYVFLLHRPVILFQPYIYRKKYVRRTETETPGNSTKAARLEGASLN